MRRRTRYLAAGALLLVAAAGPLLPGALASSGSPSAPAEVAVRFADPAIDESSGLVVRGDRLFTVNDSGGGPEVFEVDLRTGKTVGVTTYDDEDPMDVEALAPGRGGVLWVGDIGDNRRARGSVRVYRLTPSPGGGSVQAAAFDLVYPDRPHDAEALLVHPRTGRLLVVTKNLVGGGVVYRAPRRLRPGETHQLERLGRAPGLVTDGTFLPGGDRILLRTYGSASVHSYPGLKTLATVELPAQEQGEAVAVAGDRMYLGSEGEHAEVLVTDVPRAQESRPAQESSPPGVDEPEARREYDPEPWFGLGFGRFLGLAAGAALAVVGLRAALRRARRRR